MNQLEDSIKISVKTEYLEKESSPKDERFLFRYTITIVNLGEQTVKLERRQWSITDANGHESKVQGIGVVGETPTIEPDCAFRYSSGTVLETPLGVMQGHYLMSISSGEQFNATIPAFRLAIPGLLH